MYVCNSFLFGGTVLPFKQMAKFYISNSQYFHAIYLVCMQLLCSIIPDWWSLLLCGVINPYSLLLVSFIFLVVIYNLLRNENEWKQLNKTNSVDIITDDFNVKEYKLFNKVIQELFYKLWVHLSYFQVVGVRNTLRLLIITIFELKINKERKFQITLQKELVFDKISCKVSNHFC